MRASNVGKVQAIRIAPNDLEGSLGVDDTSQGLIIFAHGSGSGRFSPRNNQVAEGLRRAGMATLLLDLLRPDEEDNRAKVFDIPLLASRLLEATRWARQQAEIESLPIAYFGASTGAGAALAAAAHPDAAIAAVVSRGGRPDLAGSALAKVQAPTLLIVGGLDTAVIELNREAMAQMHAETKLVIVPGATHLFEEPGTLDQVTKLAADWFVRHLAPPSNSTENDHGI